MAPGRRVLLVGAGHAHLESIARADELAARGAQVTVVAPGPFRYTGTATGELSGRYPIGFGELDVAALARSRGACWIEDRLLALDVGAKRVTLTSGAELAYDLLSLDLGSAPAAAFAADERVHPAKPVERLHALRRLLEAAPARVLVVGAGASGCEIAPSVDALLVRLGARSAVTLLGSAPELLDGGAGARGLARCFERRGIRCVLGRRALALQGDAVLAVGGERHAFDLLVDATGSAPNPLARGLGLPLDARGALLVEPTLASIADADVFAVGDAARLPGGAAGKNGVQAVREGSVLAANLLARLELRALRACRPARRTLQILDLGDGTGLARWGPWAWRSRAMSAWKERIDRRWLARWRTVGCPTV